jgi:hypothetical protein
LTNENKKTSDQLIFVRIFRKIILKIIWKISCPSL